MLKDLINYKKSFKITMAHKLASIKKIYRYTVRFQYKHSIMIYMTIKVVYRIQNHVGFLIWAYIIIYSDMKRFQASTVNDIYFSVVFIRFFRLAYLIRLDGQNSVCSIRC